MANNNKDWIESIKAIRGCLQNEIKVAKSHADDDAVGHFEYCLDLINDNVCDLMPNPLDANEIQDVIESVLANIYSFPSFLVRKEEENNVLILDAHDNALACIQIMLRED